MSWVDSVLSGVTQAVKTTKSQDDLKQIMLQAILDHESYLGISITQQLKYQFRPYDPVNVDVIDTRVWEQAKNILVNETIQLKNPAEDGSIETKAITLTQEIAFVRVRVNKKGADDLADLSFDISVDKGNDVEDGNIGTWVVEDKAIEEFGVGDLVDLSGVVARTFSLKIMIKAGPLELTDMVVELYLIPSTSLTDHIVKLRDTVCGYIYRENVQIAVNKGYGDDTVRGLQRVMDMYLKSGLGVLALGSSNITSNQGMGKAVARAGHDDSVFSPSVAGVSSRGRGLTSGDIPVYITDHGTHKTVVLEIDTATGFRFPR